TEPITVIGSSGASASELLHRFFVSKLITISYRDFFLACVQLCGFGKMLFSKKVGAGAAVLQSQDAAARAGLV
ncbi:MAG TPA: hypothetical protein VKK06_10560, partial [Terriglobia bacterium]|nr:hypothetical protein [Terriglobia bacterium]